MSKKWMMGILAAVVLLCSGCKAEDGQSHEEAGKAALQLVTSRTGEPDASIEETVTCTDALGRDLLVRTMIGTRISLIIGVGAAIIVLIIGSIYGAISGLAGGKVDAVMMRICELI